MDVLGRHHQGDFGVRQALGSPTGQWTEAEADERGTKGKKIVQWEGWADGS